MFRIFRLKITLAGGSKHYFSYAKQAINILLILFIFFHQ